MTQSRRNTNYIGTKCSQSRNPIFWVLFLRSLLKYVSFASHYIKIGGSCGLHIRSYLIRMSVHIYFSFGRLYNLIWIDYELHRYVSCCSFSRSQLLSFVPLSCWNQRRHINSKFSPSSFPFINRLYNIWCWFILTNTKYYRARRTSAARFYSKKRECNSSRSAWNW